MNRITAFIVAMFLLISPAHALFFSEYSGYWRVVGMQSSDGVRTCSAVTEYPKENTAVMLSQDLDGPEFWVEAQVGWWNVTKDGAFTLVYTNKDNGRNEIQTGQYKRSDDKYIQIRNINIAKLIVNFKAFDSWTIMLENGDKIEIDLKGATKMIDVMIKCIQSSQGRDE